MSEKYTVECDYMATGEGRTLMILYCHAKSEADALTQFAIKFNRFYCDCAEIKEGWVFYTEVSDSIVPEMIKRFLESNDCYTEYHAQFHINCS